MTLTVFPSLAKKLLKSTDTAASSKTVIKRFSSISTFSNRMNDDIAELISIRVLTNIFIAWPPTLLFENPEKLEFFIVTLTILASCKNKLIPPVLFLKTQRTTWTWAVDRIVLDMMDKAVFDVLVKLTRVRLTDIVSMVQIAK